MAWAGNAFAQTIVSPEECILDTLKQGAANTLGAMVRFNCVMKYIRAVESQAVNQDLKYFQGAIFPYTSSRITSSNERLLFIKNDSASTVVIAYVGIVNRVSGKVDTYKMYADWPVEQFTAGTFTATFPTEVNGFDYWKTHGWTLIRVLGIPAKR